MVHGTIDVKGEARLAMGPQNPDAGWTGVHFFGPQDKVLRNTLIEGIGNGGEQVSCGGHVFIGAVSFFASRAGLENVEIKISAPRMRSVLCDLK